MISGKAAYRQDTQLVQAMDAQGGECCWIRIAEGYDGERVREGQIYISRSVSHAEALYVLVHFRYYVRSESGAALKARRDNLHDRCVSDILGRNAVKVSFFVDGRMEDCWIDYRDLPRD